MTATQMFAHNLKVARSKNHLTQEAMSEVLKVNRSTYQHWEAGTSQPKISVLSEICKTFNVSIQSFLTLDLSKTN